MDPKQLCTYFQLNSLFKYIHFYTHFLGPNDRFLLLTWENWKQAKKMTAKKEREATEADLKAAKMQVEATDAAEETKKRVDKSM